MMSTASRTRSLVYGGATIAAFLVLVVLCTATYRGAFEDWTEIEIRTGRAGLSLEAGADVTLRGVTVGEVLSVVSEDDGVVVRVGIEPEEAEIVPRDAGAEILSPSLLGPKYVELVPPGAAPDAALGIAEGTVIAGARPSLEVNAAFDDLMGMLDAINPAELNTALGAFSSTLQGRGAEFGDYLARAEEYLARFNTRLGVLESDFRRAAVVTKTYAAIAPQLLRILDSMSVTAATVVDEEQSLDALFNALYDASGETRKFLLENRMPLRDALTLLRTTTGTLAEYAPMFPCLFRSINDFRKAAEPASGGRYPGLWTHVSLASGSHGYDRIENLPRVVADAPGCSGGPIGTDGPRYQPRNYGEGSPDPYAPYVISGGADLAEILFGEGSGR